MNITCLENVPLSSLSTFGIGGNAKQFISINSPEKLLEVIKWAKKNKIKYKIFAVGSNIVFPDEGLDCLVIQILGGNMEILGSAITVDSGVLLMNVINKAMTNDLAGLESLSGIPGTVGGAVVGNAGAYGHSISETVEKVEIWDGKERKWLMNSDCQFSYRESIFKKKPYIILRVVCKLQKKEAAKLQSISQDIIKLREEKYKPDLKCPGSFFKNIVVSEIDHDLLKCIDSSRTQHGKIPAGYLLEEVGGKGMQVGGIKIAGFHGNLFINTRSGTAADVKKLAGILKQKVKERFGIQLEEEIRYF